MRSLDADLPTYLMYAVVSKAVASQDAYDFGGGWDARQAKEEQQMLCLGNTIADY